ncbi:hypothetical protein GGI15_004703, partial [Coemansia interrupta]
IIATLNNILHWSFGFALIGGVSTNSQSAFNLVSASLRSPSLPQSPTLVMSPW